MKTKNWKLMAMCTKTGLSLSYAYKKGCRCVDCVALKKTYTKREAPKARLRVKLWLQNHPGAKKGYNKKYIDKTWLNTYGELKIQQQGLCAICFKDVNGMTNSKTRLSVDHCHKTGTIRGLLCGNCNVGLGHFKDDINTLHNAISYLKRFTKDNGDVYLP